MRTFFFTLLSTMVWMSFQSCGKEEPWSGKDSPLPERPRPSVPEPFSLQWVSLVDQSTDERNIDLSTRYLGI